MPPYSGAIHYRARRDSSLHALLPWARRRRSSWTCGEAAEALDVSSRRVRALVRALEAGELVELVQEREAIGQPNYWRLTGAGRALAAVPVIEAPGGRPRAVRLPRGTRADLRAAIEASGLPPTRAARRLRISGLTLRRMLDGETPIAAYILQRAAALAAGRRRRPAT